VVDADYRLSPGARMPAHIVDVKHAIAWTREHAAEYGVTRDSSPSPAARPAASWCWLR
jgi:acetyl esterase/lipase